jgi:3-hydroxypropanoate dehydrogenase
MKSSIDRSALNQLFNEARTYNELSERPVDEQTVRDLYDLLKWGPTSANCCPARLVWVRSAEGKAKLAALAMEVNRPKILAAPVTVIIGYDLAFPETMPKLFPARGGRCA